MENRKNIKVGDYVRWLYPLGYIDIQERNYSYGLVTRIKEEEERLDGKIILFLDSGYKQLFWLSLDLLVDLGKLEILQDGTWNKVR